MGQSRHAQRESAIERRFPWIMMHNRRDASVKILPSADEKRITSRHLTSSSDDLGAARMDVVAPRVGVLIWRCTKSAVMIAMEMIVGVDETGTELPVRHPDHGV